MAAVAKLYQEGSIIFDHPVQEYVPQFPDKYFDGEKVILLNFVFLIFYI
jgi:hypothetical protein